MKVERTGVAAKRFAQLPSTLALSKKIMDGIQGTWGIALVKRLVW